MVAGNPVIAWALLVAAPFLLAHALVKVTRRHAYKPQPTAHRWPEDPFSEAARNTMILAASDSCL